MNDPLLSNDWHVLARSQDVREGKTLPVRLLGEDLVLWRSKGEVKAWEDLCIHRGARLSLGSIKGETLSCAYHGWTYDGNGQCIKMPAHPEQKPQSKARVHTYRAQEQYGLVWVSLGTPERGVPPFPQWHDSSFRRIFCGPYRYRASGPRVIESALDVAHFPFVHEGLLGDQNHAEIEDYVVETGADGITSRGLRIWQPNQDGTGRAGPVDYTFRVLRPLTMCLEKEGTKNRFAIFLNVAPVEETDSLAWEWIMMDYAFDVPEAELRSFQDRLSAQDIAVVESQRPERLPLDLQAELHLRCDRVSIAYREWLHDLGLSYGTA